MNIQEVVRNNLELAKRAIIKDGYLMNVIILVKDGAQTALPHQAFEGVPSNEAKGRNALLAGAAAATTGADMVVMVWDAAMLKMPPDTDTDKLDETDMPLSYPRSMRTECIIVHGMDFKGGESHIEVAPYKGGDGKPVEMLPRDNDLDGASMSCRFNELIKKAYDECSRQT